MKNIILETVEVTKKFYQGKKEIEVLKGITLEISRNSMNSVVGVSGVGKSTLLHIMGALEKPTSGRVLYGGVDISAMGEEELADLRNRKIGFVFQFFNLLPEFSALENVMLPLLIPGKMSRKEAERKAVSLLEEVGLSDRINHKPSDLSGGEQQRVAIARALVNEPEILFADEPTGNLDGSTARAVYDAMIALSRGRETSFVVVTHDEALVKQSDKLFRLYDGKLIL